MSSPEEWKKKSPWRQNAWGYAKEYLLVEIVKVSYANPFFYAKAE